VEEPCASALPSAEGLSPEASAAAPATFANVRLETFLLNVESLPKFLFDD
jgi:hypothetical protein